MVAGGFSIDRYLSIAKTPIIDPTAIINLISPDVLMYTQVSAGLGIGLGGLSLFLLLLRIGNFHLHLGNVVVILVRYLIIWWVSYYCRASQVVYLCVCVRANTDKKLAV